MELYQIFGIIQIYRQNISHPSDFRRCPKQNTAQRRERVGWSRTEKKMEKKAKQTIVLLCANLLFSLSFFINLTMIAPATEREQSVFLKKLSTREWNRVDPCFVCVCSAARGKLGRSR